VPHSATRESHRAWAGASGEALGPIDSIPRRLRSCPYFARGSSLASAQSGSNPRPLGTPC
jgi:hypothetical protein